MYEIERLNIIQYENKLMLSLLLQHSNYAYEQSFINSVMSQSLQDSILQIIVNQRKLINELNNELTDKHKIKGTVCLTHINDNNQHQFKLKYYSHDVDLNDSLCFETYKPLRDFEDIRDYITDYEYQKLEIGKPDKVIFLTAPFNVIIDMKNKRRFASYKR